MLRPLAILALISSIACSQGGSGSNSGTLNGLSGSQTSVGEGVKPGVYVSERTGGDRSYSQLVVSVTATKVAGNVVTSNVTVQNNRLGSNVTEEVVLAGFKIKSAGENKISVSGARTSSGSLGNDEITLTKVEQHAFSATTAGGYARFRVTIEGKQNDEDLKASILPPGTFFNTPFLVVWDARIYSREGNGLACANNNTSELQQGGIGAEMGVSNESDSRKWRSILKNCTHKETIEVPAGIFETCKVVDSLSGLALWVGNVPTGIVKMQADTTKMNFYEKYVMGPLAADVRCDFYRSVVMELAAFSH